MSGDPSRAGIWPDADVYVAPLGTEAPTVADPFGAGWDLVGLLDGEAGFVQAREEEVDDHYAWGGILVRTSRRNFKQTITFTALEDNATVRGLVWPQSAAGQIVVPRPERVRIAFELREGDTVKRLISAYEAEVTVNADITDAEGDLTRYELLVTVFPDASGRLFHEQRGTTEIAESFDTDDGALGPDLAWFEQVFHHDFQFEVVGNAAVLSADAPGSWESSFSPHPNVASPDVEITLDVLDIERGLGVGAEEYVIDVGAVVRVVTRDDNTNYRAYAAGIGRNNIFLAPGHTWHLAIFRVEGLGEGNQILLDIALGVDADVALPGTFTFTADGPNLSATFEHAGTGPTLSVDAVDATYADGFSGLGGSVVIEAGDEGTITVDNYAARAL